MAFETVLNDLKPMPGQLLLNGVAEVLELTDVLTLYYTVPGGEVRTKVLTIANAGTGEWLAEWTAGELDKVGSYKGKITVVRTTDATFPRTFPDDGTWIIWWVYSKPVTS